MKLQPKNKQETRGGTRQGSGAKPKYKEETKTVAFRPSIVRRLYLPTILSRFLNRFGEILFY